MYGSVSCWLDVGEDKINVRVHLNSIQFVKLCVMHFNEQY